MKRITVAGRLRYRFDNTMSRGPITLIGWLGFNPVPGGYPRQPP